MAQQMKWGGEVFDLVTSPTFEEMSVIERAARCGWDGLSSMEAAAGMVLVTLRRRGIILGWDDVVKLEPAQILASDAGPDPTPAADSPAAPAPVAPAKPSTTRRTRATGSRAAAPAGSPAPARRSKRSSTATS